MARDLVLDVVARKNSRDLSTLADEFDRLARQTDDFGDKLNKTTGFSKYLDEQLHLTRQRVRELGLEFEATGNKDVFANLRGAQRNIKVLEGIKADLTKAFGDTGTEASNAFSHGFVRGLGQVALAASPALVPMAVVLVSQLLAAIGGVISGGAGISAIFAGSITQIKTNPQVQAAAKDLGTWFVAEWKADTASFAAPTEDALRLLKTELRGPMADLRNDFSVIAPYTRDFANSLGRAAQLFMPGLNRLLQNSGPLIKEIGHDVEMLAEGASRFLDHISRGGKGEAEALDTLVRGLAIAIAMTGQFIEWSADLYDVFLKVAKGIAYLLQHFTPFGLILKHLLGIDLVKYVDGIGHSFDDAGPKVDAFTASVTQAGSAADLTADDFARYSAIIDSTAQTVDVLAGKIAGKLINSMLSVDQANLTVAQSLNQVADAFKQNGRELDIHKEKGEANRQAVLASVSANAAQYQSLIASGISAQDAARAYDDNTRALEAQLRKAGLTQQAIDGLIGKYRNVPSDVNTTIATRGLTEALDRLGGLIAKINGLDGRTFGFHVIEDIEVRQRINSNFGHLAHGGIRRAATGLIVGPSDPGTLIGEPQTGGEALIPLQGISRGAAAVLGRIAMAGYGLDVVPAGRPNGGGSGGYVPIRADDALTAGLVELIQRYVRGAGGDGRTLGVRTVTA